jgi:hypothetical protein
MTFFKTFLLGIGTAYGIYYITRKGPDGRSILDDLLDRPDVFIKHAKDGLMEEAAHLVKEVVK